MADRVQQLTLEGLARAVADPGGKPLHGAKGMPGLFAGSATAREAARHCKEAGYLHVVGTQTRGKSVQEICAITEKGLAYLLNEVSPKQVLEEFVRAVEARGRQVEDLVASARDCRSVFDGLRAQVEKVLVQLKPPSVPTVPTAKNGQGDWKNYLLADLARWLRDHPNEDCPVPDLYRAAQAQASGLSIGHFHDGLRQLHDQGAVYLHPWTGPLHEIPEPACALLVGHAVIYYASRR